MKLNFRYRQLLKFSFVLLTIFQTLLVQAQYSITICPGETAVLNSTINPPTPPTGAAGSGDCPSGGGPGSPGAPGATGTPGGTGGGPGGATGSDDCSPACQYTIERTIHIMGEQIMFGGNSYEVSPLTTTGYLISSRYIPGAPSPNGSAGNCYTGEWASEKFVVIVENCSNSCAANNNLGNEPLNGIATHSSELLTCFQGTIENGANIELKSGERIKLDNGFKIMQGAELKVRIESCN